MDRLERHDKATRHLKEFEEFGHSQEEARRSDHIQEASGSELHMGSSLMWQSRESSRSQKTEEPTIDSMELENNAENFLELATELSKGRTHSHSVESILGFDDRTRCAVCHQPMPKRRFHYGGFSCYSCRAFFRRRVQLASGTNKLCSAGGHCDVEEWRRKNCIPCRYAACLLSGMRPELVLNEDKKKKRFWKKIAKDEELKNNGSPVVQTSRHSASEKKRQAEEKSKIKYLKKYYKAKSLSEANADQSSSGFSGIERKPDVKNLRPLFMEPPSLEPIPAFSKSTNPFQFRESALHPGVSQSSRGVENGPPQIGQDTLSFPGLLHLNDGDKLSFYNSRKMLQTLHQEAKSAIYNRIPGFESRAHKPHNATSLYLGGKQDAGYVGRVGIEAEDRFNINIIPTSTLPEVKMYKMKQEPGIPSLKPIYPIHNLLPPLQPIPSSVPFRDAFLHQPLFGPFPPMYSISGDRQKSFSDLVQRISQFGTSVEYGNVETGLKKLETYENAFNYAPAPSLELGSAEENLPIPPLAGIKSEEPLDLSTTDCYSEFYLEHCNDLTKPSSMEGNHVSVIRFSGRNNFA